MKTDGPTAAELDKAKGYLRGQLPVQAADRGGVAQALVAAELHGLGAGYVRELPCGSAAVDEAAAKAAAGALLHPDAMLVVIVGKAAAIEPQIADKGIAVREDRLQGPDQRRGPRRRQDQEALIARARPRLGGACGRRRRAARTRSRGAAEQRSPTRRRR